MRRTVPSASGTHYTAAEGRSVRAARGGFAGASFLAALLSTVMELLVVLLAPALFLLPLVGFGIVLGLAWAFLRGLLGGLK